MTSVDKKTAPESNCNCIDITAAAEILDLGISQARAILQSPDKVVLTPTGHIHHLFCKTRVELLAQKRQCEKCERRKMRNTRCCYLCNRRYDESSLTSNICPDCQAYKWVRNFAYHGDCVCNELDWERIDTLERALKRFRCHLSQGKAKAI